ncbi:hypothetical protein Dimus_031127 [Dionaea muscipula]
MVVAGGPLPDTEKEEEKGNEREKRLFVMAAVPERSRSLHSLSLPVFKWGKQKQLRCLKLHDDDDNSLSSAAAMDHVSSIYRRSLSCGSRLCRKNGGFVGRRLEPEKRRRSLFEPEKFRNSPVTPPPWSSASEICQRRRSFVGTEDEDGIEAVRTKLMLDLQTEVDRMKVAIMKQDGDEEMEASRMEEVIRPWNLRTRRASRKDANMNGVGADGKNQRVSDRKPNGSPLTNESRVPRVRGESSAGAGASCEHAGERRLESERAKFSLSLSKKEIEEDFVAIVGIKPPRRPKKRPRLLQKQLDNLFPGFWLLEITPELYKVNENLEAAKR